MWLRIFPAAARPTGRAAALTALMLVPGLAGAQQAAPAPGTALQDGAAPMTTPATYSHLQPGDRVGDLLDHPAFAGFAPRLLPWDNRAPDPSLPLARLDTLLPYHSAVVPEVVLDGLNRLIDEAASGKPVFYDIYTDAEKAANPDLAHTGLFFLRGTPGAPFAVIAPGGGFAYVGSVHEGFPYAADISQRGFNAFVIKYRGSAGQRAATEDMARALDFIIDSAAALGVDPQDYSLWGSSAGARMAANIGSHGTAAFGADDHVGPAAVIMAYTAHSDIGTTEPPTFVAVGERDGIAPPSAMQRRVSALRRMGTEVSYNVYPAIGHGFGTGAGTSAEGWIDDAVTFWEAAIARGN